MGRVGHLVKTEAGHRRSICEALDRKVFRKLKDEPV